MGERVSIYNLDNKLREYFNRGKILYAEKDNLVGVGKSKYIRESFQSMNCSCLIVKSESEKKRLREMLNTTDIYSCKDVLEDLLPNKKYIFVDLELNDVAERVLNLLEKRNETVVGLVVY